MLIKYKGGIYKRVDASSEVIEKLQSVIEKRLKAAVELLKVRGLRFGFSKEQIKENLVAFYVAVTWSSSGHLTDKQKNEVKEQLEHLLLQGLKPLESMQMFKEHELELYSRRWEDNKLLVAMVCPDASKLAGGRDKGENRALGKVRNQYIEAIQGVFALHRGIAQLSKEEDSFDGSFEKNIGKISAVAPRLATELTRDFAILTKTAKNTSVLIDKAMQIEKATDHYNDNSIAEAIKQLQRL